VVFWGAGAREVDQISFSMYFSNVSRAEIISEIPKLSHEERREIMRCLIQSEEDAVTLAECDQRAWERFQMLDTLEAEDEKNAAR